MFLTLTLDEAVRLGVLRVGKHCDVDRDVRILWPKEGCDLCDDDFIVLGDDCIVRSGSVIYWGCRIGKRAQLGHHAVLRNHTILGEGSVFGTGAVSEGRVKLGRHVMVETGCILQPGMVIEDFAFLGPRVTCSNDKHIRWCREGMRQELNPPRVGRGARIGAGAVLLPGMSVGANALVGAGAVVTHDVPENAVVVGVPARIIGQVPTQDRIGEE